MTTVALIVALAMPLLADEEPGWREFQSKDGGFSVLMPGTPVAQEQSADSRIGPIRSRMYVVDRRSRLHRRL